MNALAELQNWYLAQCNGDWEHEFGVHIETLDNPGWHLTTELKGTLLEDQTFDAIEYGDSELLVDNQSDQCPDDPNFGNWVRCYVKDNIFHGVGGALKLEEIVGVFLKWAHETETRESTPQAQARRELRDREKADRAYWKLLGDEVWERDCSIDNCPNKCARHVAFCRKHQFKKAKGYAYPFEDKSQSDNRVLE